MLNNVIIFLVGKKNCSIVQQGLKIIFNVLTYITISELMIIELSDKIFLGLTLFSFVYFIVSMVYNILLNLLYYFAKSSQVKIYVDIKMLLLISF